MQYGVWSAGLVAFISAGYMESMGKVELQSLRILLVYVHSASPLAFGEVNQGLAVAAAKVFAVYKEHLYRVPVQTDKPDSASALNSRKQLYGRKIKCSQFSFYCTDSLIIQKAVRGSDGAFPYRGEFRMVRLTTFNNF